MRTWLFAFAIILVLSGCAATQYSSPRYSGLTPIDLPSIVTEAQFYVKAYDARADDLADDIQLFELPIIGSAVGAATALSVNSYKFIPLGFALGGGTASIVEGYYAPRQRVPIYDKGAQAMRCIQNLAGQTFSL